MDELFGDDEEQIRLLQEFMGYCLTPDTSQQKMLLIVGPKRGGKGTISRVLTRLIGKGNVCNPTTSNLASQFGLQQLIGKSLAIVGDSRFSGSDVPKAIERLLNISGEDALTIDRKYLGAVTMKLPTRFVFLSNESPKLPDASGALANRFMILRLAKSFFGREDTRLAEKLLEELPGILNWSIDGWKRLQHRGHFVMPKSVLEDVTELEDMASPVGAFVREKCVLGPSERVKCDELYRAFKKYSEEQGCKHIPIASTFGRNLKAAVPEINRRRGTKNEGFYEGIDLKILVNPP